VLFGRIVSWHLWRSSGADGVTLSNYVRRQGGIEAGVLTFAASARGLRQRRPSRLTLTADSAYSGREAIIQPGLNSNPAHRRRTCRN